MAFGMKKSPDQLGRDVDMKQCVDTGIRWRLWWDWVPWRGHQMCTDHRSWAKCYGLLHDA